MFLMKQTILALFVFSALAFAQVAGPIPNTYVSVGATGNLGSPYMPAAYGAYGLLVNSGMSTLPTFAGFRYELYRDSTGKPAYGGMATLKTVVWRSNRLFAFADASLGGAGSVSGISTAIAVGGGVGVILGKSITPHWEIVVEPRAQRIPALQNGISGGALVGVNYSFNRPQ